MGGFQEATHGISVSCGSAGVWYGEQAGAAGDSEAAWWN